MGKEEPRIGLKEFWRCYGDKLHKAFLNADDVVEELDRILYAERRSGTYELFLTKPGMTCMYVTAFWLEGNMRYRAVVRLNLEEGREVRAKVHEPKALVYWHNMVFLNLNN